MAWQIKARAAKPDVQSPIPGTHMVEKIDFLNAIL